MSDHKGAGLVLKALPPDRALIADRGYDSIWFWEALRYKGSDPCIPSSHNRSVPFPYDKALYRQHHKVENLFANSPPATPAGASIRLRSKTGALSRPATTAAPKPSS